MHSEINPEDEIKAKFYEIAPAFIRPVKDVYKLAMTELHSPPESIKISGWQAFNEITGGLRMKEFSILCGATGTGKTSLLANLSANLLTQRVKHFVASVETGDEDFIRRVASCLLDLDVNDGKQFSYEQVQAWSNQLEFVLNSEDLHLSIMDNRMPVNFLVESLRYASRVLGCRVAMLDNLNFFLDVKAAEQTLVEMDRVIHELIMFCKQTEMHIIMVMHPKKTDNGRVESEFDIKGSSTAVQEAHNVFLFNRISEELVDRGFGKHCRELTARKLRRRGRYSGITLVFDGFTPCYKEKDIV